MLLRKKSTGEPFDDGAHILYVNGEYRDNSDIGKLMHDFRCTSSIDMFYDVLKKGMRHYKETEGGRAAVCKAIETYGEKRELDGKIETAKRMIADNMPDEQVAKYSGLPIEKVQELKAKTA